MLVLGTGVVFVVAGIALGAYHAGNDTQKSAANSALDSAKEEIEGIVDQIVGSYNADAPLDLDETNDGEKPADETNDGEEVKSKKKSSGTSSPTTDMLNSKAKSSKSGVVTTSSPSTDSLPDGGGSSKSSKSDGGTSSPTADMLSGKSGKVGNAKSSTSSPSTDGLTTSSPTTDSLPAGGYGIEKDEEEVAAEIAFMSLSQAEYSMSMFTRRQYN